MTQDTLTPAEEEGRSPGPPPEPRQALREGLLAFGAATVLAAALYWIGQAVPIVQRNLGGLVALVFLGIAIHLLDRRHEPLARYGISWKPLGRGLAWGLGASVVVLGLFMAGYYLYFESVCGGGQTWLGPLGRQCERWAGSGARLHLPPGFGEQVLAQILVVAIPEEIFYRGYLLGRLERALPARRTLWGVPVGAALLLHAACFGLGHFLMDWNPLRLGVAVPALAFAFLRHKGGSIVAPVVFHAAANLLMLVVDPSFFP